MTFQLEKTPWLPPAPADFSQRCKALAAAGNGGALVASLASFARSANQCATLARAEKGARHVEKLSDFRECPAKNSQGQRRARRRVTMQQT